MSLQSKLAHPTDVLKFAFWNINGYKSKILGNKLVLRDFLQEIGNNDIVGLAETHIHPKTLDDLAIPGFTRIDFKIREPHSKGRCGSGGIAIFCKNNISDFFLPIENDNKDVIWVKIKKELLGRKGYLPSNNLHKSSWQKRGHCQNLRKT